MKTTLKTIAVFAGLLLLAGCAAQAGDTPNQTFNCPGYGPGWRHEQMVQARMNNTGMPCGMAVRGQGFGPGYGQGMRGYGPPTNADGTIDTSKLPAWCPYATKTDQTPQNVVPKTE
ncbi:hypothetical protein [Magnetospirillum sp. 64-120]|uniref:hypothetical protein n=1 Tax=Magnetospirillum sp. 64-120 TaxID=1895778 RepID=UPI000927561C|nr:hypothetical protein [Magnetospirillum sp. 64-120]OJX79480.1 MAG: hypothetical protein BGO92_13505 [Magnetospirillum sp. 64-120]